MRQRCQWVVDIAVPRITPTAEHRNYILKRIDLSKYEYLAGLSTLYFWRDPVPWASWKPPVPDRQGSRCEGSPGYYTFPRRSREREVIWNQPVLIVPESRWAKLEPSPTLNNITRQCAISYHATVLAITYCIYLVSPVKTSAFPFQLIFHCRSQGSDPHRQWLRDDVR